MSINIPEWYFLLTAAAVVVAAVLALVFFSYYSSYPFFDSFAFDWIVVQTID
jgi:hypothetical protein